MTETKFDLGEVYFSTRIVRSMQKDLSIYNFVRSCLDRYKQCDWGDIDEEEKDKNTNAVTNGDRIFASYGHIKRKIWIITEADRSYTSILFPDEYQVLFQN